jgi:HlyD family secretion protein
MSRRNLIALTAGSLLVAAIVWGFLPKPVAVETAGAARERLEVRVDEEGRTRVVDRYVVSAPVAGYGERLELEVGDQVGQGELLLSIQPLPSSVLDPRSRAEAEAAVAAAEARVRAAERAARAAAATAELAAVEYERLQKLFVDQLVSRERVDQAAAAARRTADERDSAEAQVEVARYELAAARTALEYAGQAVAEDAEPVDVRSPIDGRVLERMHVSEGVLAAGAPIVELGDPSSLEIEVDVLSEDAVRIRPGMPVRIDRWGGDRPLEAVVERVEPAGFTKISALGVEEQRVLVISRITSPRELWAALGDGYRVEASFELWGEDDVLQVPASALFRHEGGWAVFVAEDGRARMKAVEIGRRNPSRVQVLSGLEPGQRVVLHPPDTLESGARIESGSSPLLKPDTVDPT